MELKHSRFDCYRVPARIRAVSQIPLAIGRQDVLPRVFRIDKTVKNLINNRVQTMVYGGGQNLRSSRRLFEHAQHSPIANQILGLDQSRGSHTEDVEKETVAQLTYIELKSPKLYRKLIEKYGLDSEQFLLHAVEYVRLHDALTLAFQGALHGKVLYNSVPYSEDEMLLAAFEDPVQFKPMYNLVHDDETKSYYAFKGIDINVVLAIASDAANGTNLIAQLLKGHDFPSIDWFSYTSRDAHTLLDKFNIDNSLPFDQQMYLLIKNLRNVSNLLTQGHEYHLPQRSTNENSRSIDELIPTGVVRLKQIGDEIKLVYDAGNLFQTYVKHLILRLFHTGSEWIRGGDRQIRTELLQQFSYPNELVHLALHRSERQLLSWGFTHMISPNGWKYTTTPSDYHPSETFSFRNIENQLVRRPNGNLGPFGETFPELVRIVKSVSEQELYLQQI